MGAVKPAVMDTGDIIAVLDCALLFLVFASAFAVGFALALCLFCFGLRFGFTLAMCWCCVGSVVVLFWFPCGFVCWLCFGFVLVLFRFCFGFMMANWSDWCRKPKHNQNKPNTQPKPNQLKTKT